MGAERSCVKFKVVTLKKGAGKGKRAFRCVKFKEGLKHPQCPPGKLKGGGRSQNYLRPSLPGCTRAGKSK